jgi:hypothetical protein
MKHFSDNWVKDWCQENGWTDLFIERYNNYWAFPPGAVIPEPIPPKTLREIKLEKGLCEEERFWLTTAIVVTMISVLLGYFLKCPMPFVFAFAFDAIVAGQMEVEEI